MPKSLWWYKENNNFNGSKFRGLAILTKLHYKRCLKMSPNYWRKMCNKCYQIQEGKMCNIPLKGPQKSLSWSDSQREKAKKNIVEREREMIWVVAGQFREIFEFPDLPKPCFPYLCRSLLQWGFYQYACTRDFTVSPLRSLNSAFKHGIFICQLLHCLSSPWDAVHFLCWDL